MLSVVVVEPQRKGNVGTIARAMKNFGFKDLKLVDPPVIEPGDEAYGFAGHAREDVLPNYEVCTFEAVIEGFHTVGFTAITGEDERRHVRYPFTSPAALAEDLAAEFDAPGGEPTEFGPKSENNRFDAPIALVFGREGSGLSNDELARMDEICSIPASAEYPVLNLGQAATIALYELRDLADTPTQHASRTRATVREAEGLYDQLDELLRAIDHPVEKRPKAKRLFRRVFGRARLTGREATTLWGVVRRATELIDERP